MRIVIIGAVAAGTSAAAKARRNDEAAEITVYERDRFISYSGCGMPYFLGGSVSRLSELVPRDAAFFKSKYRVEVKTQHEVLQIDPEEKKVTVRNLETGETFDDHWDKLIIATGAAAVLPLVSGSGRNDVFTLRTIGDMIRIREWIAGRHPQTAVIVGTGLIGLEVCENLSRSGINVTLVEKFDHIMPALDRDMSALVEAHLIRNGIKIYTGVVVSEVGNGTVFLADGTKIAADLTLIAAGIKPETSLAKSCGVLLAPSGAIVTNERMETSVPGIWACGDCVEQTHLITGKKVWRPLGSTANKTGRIAGDQVTGGQLTFRGIIGTGIFSVFGLTVAQTGLSERDARESGFDPVTAHLIKPDKPDYMGGTDMTIKAVADRTSGRLLGAQIVGMSGVDKRIDVFVTAITFGAKAEDLFHLDLAYAPPFSTTKDPVMYTGMVLDNAIAHARPLITAEGLDALAASGQTPVVIDARAAVQYEAGHVPGAVSIPHEILREKLSELDKNAPTVTYCNKGVTGNAAQSILCNSGFTDVKNLSGGYTQYQIANAGCCSAVKNESPVL
jgi:NADPH-dependent 2,4-dienoyl-CoA reductase/sulfur reductase-like enzyme/rhodanese-related sulfurtransferase